MYIAFIHVVFDHTCDKMANHLFQGNGLRHVGSIYNDYRYANSEVNWEEMEWLKIIKYIIEVKRLIPVVSRRLVEISKALD